MKKPLTWPWRSIIVQGNQDIWLLDGARTSRFTFDAASDTFPAWSPDGTRIVFSSRRTGATDLYMKLTSGAGVEERLVASDQVKIAGNWPADGRMLLYASIDPQTSTDLWVMPMVVVSHASVWRGDDESGHLVIWSSGYLVRN